MNDTKPMTMTMPIQAVETVLRGLSKLTIEEAGDLFFTLREAARAHVAEKPDAHKEAPAE